MPGVEQVNNPPAHDDQPEAEPWTLRMVVEAVAGLAAVGLVLLVLHRYVDFDWG